MRSAFIFSAVAFVALANASDAGITALLRREVFAHAPGQDPQVPNHQPAHADEHAEAHAQQDQHKLHEKIEKQAQWAERLERHENEDRSASAHEHTGNQSLASAYRIGEKLTVEKIEFVVTGTPSWGGQQSTGCFVKKGGEGDEYVYKKPKDMPASLKVAFKGEVKIQNELSGSCAGVSKVEASDDNAAVFEKLSGKWKGADFMATKSGNCAKGQAFVNGIGEAIKCIHNKGYAHNDLSENNVMYKGDDDNDYVPQLIDFGRTKKSNDFKDDKNMFCERFFKPVFKKVKDRNTYKTYSKTDWSNICDATKDQKTGYTVDFKC